MVTCRICQHESSEDRDFCSNCGHPLATFPSTLGQVPLKFQEILSQREAWERRVWQQYSEVRSRQDEIVRQNQDLQKQVKQLQNAPKSNLATNNNQSGQISSPSKGKNLLILLLISPIIFFVFVVFLGVLATISRGF